MSDPPVAVRRHLQQLAVLLWVRRGELALALACTALAAATFLLLPVWVARLFGGVFQSGDWGLLAVHVAVGLGIFSIASGFNFARTYLMMRLAHRITAGLREQVFHRVLNADPTTIAERGGGDLLSRFSNDIHCFHTGLSNAVAVLIPSTVMLLSFAGAMVIYSWQLSLVAGLVVLPLILVTGWFGRRLHGVTHVSQALLGTLMQRFEASIGGLREIKSCNRAEALCDAFDDESAKTLASLLERERLVSMHPVAVGLAAAVGVAGMLLISAWMLQQGISSLDRLMAFLLCLGMTYGPLQESSHAIGHLMQLLAVMDRLDSVSHLPAEAGGGTALERSRVCGEIRLEGLGFSYDREGFGIRDLDLVIPAGQSVAIVGPSGAGKSTLLDLIAGFLEPQQGRIRIDGQDSRDIRRRDLRACIGLVFQEPVIFEGTLLENLRFAAPDADLASVRSAARAAHVEEFASRLPEGYDTRLGPWGLGLSVGQRQRLAIARVFLKDPPILLLDEPTSALDAQSEQMVRDALMHASEGRTTIVVAHRMSTVAAMERVLTMDAGGIIEDRGLAC